MAARQSDIALGRVGEKAQEIAAGPLGARSLHQAPEGLLAELQHLAGQLLRPAELLVGIAELLTIELHPSPLDLAACLAAAGAKSQNFKQKKSLNRKFN